MANQIRYSGTSSLNEQWSDLGNGAFARVHGVIPVDANGNPQIGDGAFPKTDRSITASSTSQQAAPENTSRRRLLIQNLDAAINVHVNLGAPATTGAGSLRLAPGSSLELTGTSQAVNVVATSGAPIVTIWEF